MIVFSSTKNITPAQKAMMRSTGYIVLSGTIAVASIVAGFVLLGVVWEFVAFKPIAVLSFFIPPLLGSWAATVLHTRAEKELDAP